MQITFTPDELAAAIGLLTDQQAAKTVALLQPLLSAIRQEIKDMGDSLEAQLQAAQAATSAALGNIANDLTALAGRLVPGQTITQADVDAANAIAAAATAAQGQADALLNPPAP